VVAVINFAGGGGGNPQSVRANRVRARLRRQPWQLWRTSQVPTLWIYAENDLYSVHVTPGLVCGFPPRAGNGEFLLLQPFGDNGHRLFARGF